MSLKEMDSFLRYVTMGAKAARSVASALEGCGYEIVELERYASSNKIWMTKVKRLRLPDLLCVKTGIRFEVRAKSNLEIAMSHSPGNPDRHWDAGLRDEDIVVLVNAYEAEAELEISPHLNAFRVSELRASQEGMKTGGAKSSSESSEITVIGGIPLSQVEKVQPIGNKRVAPILHCISLVHVRSY